MTLIRVHLTRKSKSKERRTAMRNTGIMFVKRWTTARKRRRRVREKGHSDQHKDGGRSNLCPECSNQMTVGGRVPSQAGGYWLIFYCRKCETLDASLPVTFH